VIAAAWPLPHNGSLAPLSRMDNLILPEVAATLVGTTDSERYFAVLRSALRAGRPFTETVRAAASQLRERYPLASMNALLLTPTHLAVFHANQCAPVPYEDFVEATTNGTLPAGHNESYYRMHVRERADGSLAFASTGVDVANWEELPAESITVIELATMRRQLLDLRTEDRTAAALDPEPASLGRAEGDLRIWH
jgi:hypothetical protein